MHSDLIHDLLTELARKSNGKVEIGGCTESRKEKVESLSIPIPLKRLFQSYWFKRPFSTKHYLHTVEAIINCDSLDRYLSDSVMPIGTCQNGDIIALDVANENCPVLFLAHDEIGEDEDASIRENSVMICPSLAEFLFRIFESRFLPIDYYSGKGYREVLDGMK